MNRSGASSALKAATRGAGTRGKNYAAVTPIVLQKQKQRSFVKPAYDLAKKVRE